MASYTTREEHEALAATSSKQILALVVAREILADTKGWKPAENSEDGLAYTLVKSPDPRISVSDISAAMERIIRFGHQASMIMEITGILGSSDKKKTFFLQPKMLEKLRETVLPMHDVLAQGMSK